MRRTVLMISVLLLFACEVIMRHEIQMPEQVHQNSWDLAILVNEHRDELGLPPLRWDPDLWMVAHLHNEDMRSRNFFSHFNPDGDSPFDRLRCVYIGYYHAAENLAFGQTSPSVVLCNWLRSPEHRRNIESGLYTHHAVAYDSIENHWTHLFINYGPQKPFPLITGWTRYPRVLIRE